MSKEIIRKTNVDKFTQFIIDSGKFIVDISDVKGVCKRALEEIEQRNEDKFVENVLKDINAADVESLDSVKSLKRLYRAVQALKNITTQEKINRFKKLVVNGIINQDTLSDDNYELFVNIIENLTDTEFLILLIINRIESEHIDEAYDLEISKKAEKQVLCELNMDNHLFIAYVTLLKGKGMITPLIGSVNNPNNREELMDVIFTTDATVITGNENFCINNVNGHVSILFKQLLDFIK